MMLISLAMQMTMVMVVVTDFVKVVEQWWPNKLTIVVGGDYASFSTMVLVMVMVVMINLHRMRLLHDFGQWGSGKGMSGKDWEEEEDKHCRKWFSIFWKVIFTWVSRGIVFRWLVYARWDEM